MEWMIIFKGFPWKWRMHCWRVGVIFSSPLFTVNRCFQPLLPVGGFKDLIWGNDPNLELFQMGWFNHQLHPGRLTWNIQITHLERKMIFQTSRELCSMLIFQGVDCKLQKMPKKKNTKLPKTGGAKGLCARRHRCRGEGRTPETTPDSTMGFSNPNERFVPRKRMFLLWWMMSVKGKIFKHQTCWPFCKFGDLPRWIMMKLTAVHVHQLANVRCRKGVMNRAIGVSISTS